MKLLYFTDISQLHYVLDKESNLLIDTKPFTIDLVVAFELKRLNIDFIDGWDYLTSQEIEVNYDNAHKLAFNWWNELKINDIHFKGFSLLDTVVQEFIYPFEASLNASVAFRKLFKEFQIEQILGFFLPQVGVIRTGPSPAHKVVGSVVQSILFYYAELNNIPIKSLEYHAIYSKLNLKRGFSLNRFKKKDLKKITTLDSKTALFVTDIISGKEQAALKNVFSKLEDWKTVSINIYDISICPFNEGNEIKRELEQGWHSVIRAIGHYKGSYPEIFGNSHLIFQFKRIWDEINIAVDYGNFFSTFLDLVKPSVIVFGFDAFTTEVVLVEISKAKDISTISLLHGGIGHCKGMRGLVGRSEKILVWNENDIANLKFYGISETRLIKIGSIKYENQLLNYFKNFILINEVDKIRVKKRYGIQSNGSIILFMTAAINVGFANPTAHPPKHIIDILELVEFIKIRSDLTFILKPHPGYDYHELYRRLVGFDIPNLFYIEDISIEEALIISDICVMLNYFTSAGLDAMLSKKPLIYFNNSVYPLPEWKENINKFNLNKVSSIGELETRIDKLILDPYNLYLSLNENDSNIRDILDVSSSESTKKFIEFIKKFNNKNKIKSNEFHKNIHIVYKKGKSSLVDRNLIYKLLFEVQMDYDDNDIIRALSFYAGLNNLNIKSISNLVDYFYHNKMNHSSLTSKEIWWICIHSFIAGYNSNTFSGNIAGAFKLIGFLLRRPNKLFSFTKIEIKNYFKCTLKMLLS